MKINWIGKAFVCFAVAFFWGCEGMEIDKVKNGTLNEYKQTTIGKAIESSLGNVKWSYFETDKGVRVVEARGLPSVGMITLFDEEKFESDVEYLHRPDILDLSDLCHIALTEENNVAEVQFVLHADSDDSFEVYYCGLHKNNGVSCDLFLQYIYNNGTRYEPVAKRCDEIERVAEVERAKEGKLTDVRDGKSYKTIKIGEQTWMAENLAYEYNVDGEKYGTFERKYGYGYTWAAAMDSVNTGCGAGSGCSPSLPVQGICPDGWHMPSEDEIRTLIVTVGDYEVAGNMLKSRSGWEDEGDGIDAFGFSALPSHAGCRVSRDGYCDYDAGFWSSTTSGDYYAYGLGMNGKLYYSGNDGETHFSSRYMGEVFSVRCVKD